MQTVLKEKKDFLGILPLAALLPLIFWGIGAAGDVDSLIANSVSAIDRMKLKRYIEKRDRQQLGPSYTPVALWKFPPSMEKALADHVKQLADMLHGLVPFTCIWVCQTKQSWCASELGSWKEGRPRLVVRFQEATEPGNKKSRAHFFWAYHCV